MLDEVAFVVAKLLHARVGSSIASSWTGKLEEANASVRYLSRS
jgi:hypothetical protein